MSDAKIRAVSFVEAVLLRPKMYTLSGSFEEAIAFLEGYYSGMAKIDPNVAPVAEWVAFRHWLAQRLDVSSSSIFQKFIETTNDKHELPGRFAEYFSMFQEETNRKP